jgi:hypothetical protein
VGSPQWALLMVALLVGFGTVVGVIATVVAAVTVVTAAVGFCQLYAPFHLRTTERRDVTT